MSKLKVIRERPCKVFTHRFSEHLSSLANALRLGENLTRLHVISSAVFFHYLPIMIPAHNRIANSRRTIVRKVQSAERSRQFGGCFQVLLVFSVVVWLANEASAQEKAVFRVVAID